LDPKPVHIWWKTEKVQESSPRHPACISVTTLTELYQLTIKLRKNKTKILMIL